MRGLSEPAGIITFPGVNGYTADLDKRNAAIAKAWKIVKDDISYLPLHHQVISWASKSNVDVPIRPNNEPLFRTASFN